MHPGVSGDHCSSGGRSLVGHCRVARVGLACAHRGAACVGAVARRRQVAMDVLTQLQEHVNATCALFFTHVGVLQRDAPPAGGAGDAGGAGGGSATPNQAEGAPGGAGGAAAAPKTAAEFRAEVSSMAETVLKASAAADALISALPDTPSEAELDRQLDAAVRESEALEMELLQALEGAEDALVQGREVYAEGTATYERRRPSPR